MPRTAYGNINNPQEEPAGGRKNFASLVRSFAIDTSIASFAMFIGEYSSLEQIQRSEIPALDQVFIFQERQR